MSLRPAVTPKPGAPSRLNHVLEVGYANKPIQRPFKFKPCCDTSRDIPNLATRNDDGVGLFVTRLKYVRWALENIRSSSYLDFENSFEFCDSSKNYAPFAACTHLTVNDENRADPANGWTFEIYDNEGYTPVFQKGGRDSGSDAADARMFLQKAEELALDLVKQSGVPPGNVWLVWPDTNEYVAAYDKYKESQKEEAAQPVDIDANAWGFNPLGTTDFDELVRKTKKQYPGKLWVCTLRGKTLKRSVYMKGGVKVKSDAFQIQVTVGNRIFILDWDQGDLSKLAKNAKYSPNGTEALNMLALDHAAIASEMKVSWKPRAYYSGYSKCQMSNTGLRKLALNWDNPASIAGILKTISVQYGTAVNDLLTRPAAQRAVAWGVFTGLVDCFGGNMMQFVPSSAWMVVEDNKMS